MDLDCIEKQRKEASIDIKNSPKESVMSASKLRKNKATKDVLNKCTSQIRKPSRRKTSPLNWFPRKKGDSYLARKIKLLQEVDGMNLTLDETLGDSNPHYSRVLREKIAIREAAEKAVQAQKAAMVEASWCRILRAASIESKEAEAQLSKAEKCAAEAFEAATTVGVIMNDIPDCSKRYGIETPSSKGRGSTPHNVTATFETAFEVDKKVAAAVKAAFVRLANFPSINKDEFTELLTKISQNPNVDEYCLEFAEYIPGSELEGICEEKCGSERRNYKKRQVGDKLNRANLVEMMLERLRLLEEKELASLATIVATCGLNAALAEAENTKKSTFQDIRKLSVDAQSKMSSNGRTTRNSNAYGKTKSTEVELPSLDKFLVKRLTRLEREVLEAKIARRNEATKGSNPKLDKSEDEKLFSENEKDIDKATVNDELTKMNGEKLEKMITVPANCGKQDFSEVPSLDKVLVKHLSRLERVVQEAGSRKNSDGGGLIDKENMDMNKIGDKNVDPNLLVEETLPKAGLSSFQDENDGRKKAENNLDKIVVEPDLMLQRTKKERPSLRSDVGVLRHQREYGGNSSTNYESLDNVLVKHVSRLEREKTRFHTEEDTRMKLKRKDTNRESESLDQVLVKRKSRLEREKMTVAEVQDDHIKHPVSRREARDRELWEAWGGLSLGNSIRPHVSRLERDKAAWIKAEEEERRRALVEQV
ncbi:uncharacterized protein LOC111403809 [Olea europaea var. sylvestris]|uniref:uncharacterized protein LOC111403809 n=1 Tax=Olea europaea var. sylvestris TaxID=158386 RepID=UPI000C1D1B19|nr:uncharacterized protein LOC111403809 [Olea europaea var. sylvestris]